MFEQRVSTGYSSHDAHETDKPVSSSSGHCTWRLEIQFEQHFDGDDALWEQPCQLVCTWSFGRERMSENEY